MGENIVSMSVFDMLSRLPKGISEKALCDPRQLQYLMMRLPPIVDLEVTNRCNLSCAMCPRQSMTRPSGTMSEQTFCQVLDKCPPGATVVFSGMGEPLLHPQISEFIGRLKQKRGIFVVLQTNGALLRSDVVCRLADAGLDTVCISFNGATPEVYEAVMRGARFEKVVEQIEHLVASAADRIKIRISITATKINAHEVDAIKSFWIGRGIHDFEVRLCHSRGGNLRDDAVFDFAPPPAAAACGVFARIYFIAWSGDVLSCCHDLSGRTAIGNVHNVDWSALRQLKMQRILQERWFPICDLCDDELRFELLGIPVPSATRPVGQESSSQVEAAGD